LFWHMQHQVTSEFFHLSMPGWLVLLCGDKVLAPILKQCNMYSFMQAG